MSRLETCVTRGQRQTMEAGGRLATRVSGGDVVLLYGPIGAGKSVFARGMAENLGAVRWHGSPTFSLIHQYETDPVLIHADLYRLQSSDLENIGLEEHVNVRTVLVVEWADRAATFFSQLATNNTYSVRIDYLGMLRRRITIDAEHIDPAVSIP